MEDLRKRVREAIAKAREGHPQTVDWRTNTGEAIAALAGHVQGIEDALDQVALEVEKLAATVENEAARNKD